MSDHAILKTICLLQATEYQKHRRSCDTESRNLDSSAQII